MAGRYKRAMELIVSPQGFAGWRGRKLPCALGRSGITRNKREGDGATPAATFGILRVLYRADRVAPPATRLPVASISPTDGWCDAPDSGDYNRMVSLPHAASCERLWRGDHIYDILAITSFNHAPVTPGRGSAIFVHLARDGMAPTEGCIAFTQEDLLAILADWVTEDVIRVAKE